MAVHVFPRDTAPDANGLLHSVVVDIFWQNDELLITLERAFVLKLVESGEIRWGATGHRQVGLQVDQDVFDKT
jgi:hypothetical protein